MMCFSPVLKACPRAVFAHRLAVVAYLAIFSAVMGVGAFFARPKKA